MRISHLLDEIAWGVFIAATVGVVVTWLNLH